MDEFTHFDEQGHVRMVDVSEKPVTRRAAVASAIVTMNSQTLRAIVDRTISKGDVLQVARLAGIMGAKQTGQLIPLCHPLSLTRVDLEATPQPPERLRLEARVSVEAQTGAEMEALTAVTIAALTVYDMCKSVDRGMQIGPIQLEEKSGGKSGDFRRSDLPDND